MSDNITHLNPISGGKGTVPKPLEYTITYWSALGSEATKQVITGWLMVAGGLTMVVDDNAQILFAVRTDTVDSIQGIPQEEPEEDGTWTFTPDEQLN